MTPNELEFRANIAGLDKSVVSEVVARSFGPSTVCPLCARHFFTAPAVSKAHLDHHTYGDVLILGIGITQRTRPPGYFQPQYYAVYEFFKSLR